jgi:RNA polymerase sigma factor (sigma-70 family)
VNEFIVTGYLVGKPAKPSESAACPANHFGRNRENVGQISRLTAKPGQAVAARRLSGKRVDPCSIPDRLILGRVHPVSSPDGQPSGPLSRSRGETRPRQCPSSGADRSGLRGGTPGPRSRRRWVHASVRTRRTGRPLTGRFRSTRWGDVLAARDPTDPGTREALARLYRTYWYPLYAYIRRKGFPPEHAEDLTQGFFSDGLSRSFLRGVDPARGRFRSFLLASFENYLRNEQDRARRVKRGGRVAILSIDGGGAEARYLREPTHVETAERLYDRRWALTLIDRALDRLERRMAEQGKGQLFDRLKPALLGTDDAVAYAHMASELGMTEGSVKVAAHRLRGRLRESIRAEIAETVSDPADVDQEIRDLFSALNP